jgi:hypothetical protein
LRARPSSAATTRRSPTSAWRRASKFLKVIDYHYPAWAKTYMSAVAKTLGDAYAEPAMDVESYIAYVKGQKK